MADRSASNSTERYPDRMIFLILFVLVSGTALCVALPDLATFFEAGLVLVFGWFPFLDRTLALASVDGPSLLMGVVAFLVLFAVTHWLGRSVVVSVGSLNSSIPRRWTWQSTIAVTFGLTVLFAAGIAVVGAGHQLLWLISGVRSHTSATVSPAWPARPGPLNFIGDMRRSAWRRLSRENLKMLGLGMHNYCDTWGQFPPGAIILSDGRGYRGWVAPLGPYVTFSDEWSHRLSQQPWDGADVAQFGKGALRDLVNPELGMSGQFDEHGFAYMHYAGNVHIFPNNRGMRLNDITDGTSTTLAIGEVAENFQPWASPWNRRDPADGINDVPWGFGGPPAANGAYFAFADGSVREISRNIDRQVLTALGTPAAGDRAVVRSWAEQQGMP